MGRGGGAFGPRFGITTRGGRRHPSELRPLHRKTLDNNDLVLASSGFSENKGLGGVFSLAGL